MIDHLTGSAVQYVLQNPAGAAATAKRAVGRFAGLGGTDLDAVQQSGFPAWMWIAVGLAGGVAAGAFLAMRYPAQVPSFLRGTR